MIKDQPVKLDREKVGLNTMVFAHVKLTSHGRSNLAEFSEAVSQYPEVLDCYVLLGNVDYLLRIVTQDIKAYERFFFEKLSQLPRHPGGQFVDCAFGHQAHDGAANLMEVEWLLSAESCRSTITLLDAG